MRKLIAILLLLHGLGVMAQPYNYRLYNDRDGLPGTYIYSSYQDSRGFLWVCTTGGLSRFDGRHFVNYGLINGLPTNRVTNIQEDTAGNLWIGTRNGLCKFDGRHFKIYPLPHVTGTTYFFDLSLSPQKLIRVNVNGYIFFIRHDSLIQSPVIMHLPVKEDSLIRYAIKLANGDSMVNSTKGKTYLLHKGAIVHTYPEIDNTFVSFFLQNNQVYAFSEKGIYIITPDNCKQVFTFPKSTVSLLCVMFDRQGRAWISLEESGVLLYDPKSNSGQLLPGIPTTFSASIYEDAQGTIWINNNHGLLKLTPSFTQLFNKQYLPEQDSKTAFTMPNGDIYFATQTYLFKNNFGSLTPLPQQVHQAIVDGKSRYGITGMTEGKDNVFWMTSFSGVLYQYANGILTNIDKKFNLDATIVSEIKYSLKDDVLLVPQLYFLLKLHGDQADTIKQATDGTPIRYITRMVTDADSNIWMIDKRNIYRYNGKQLVNMTPVINPGAVEIAEMFFSGDEVWIATAGLGLLRYRQAGGKFILLNRFTTADGLTNNTLMSVTRDVHGSYWVCGSSGIDQLKFTNGNKALIRHYTAEDGIAIADWSYARLAASKDGFVWCVSSDGILRIQPAVITQGNYLPVVHIENVSAINQQLEWQNPDSASNNFFHLPPDAKLANNINDLTFHFTGIGFTSNIIKYMYMLQGVDTKWVTSDKEDAIYLGLTPGTYTFKVKAINSSGAISHETSYTVEILPPFWRTWWFRSLVIIGVIALIFYLVKLREKNIKKQNMITLQMSELKMQALQSQMNPHFIFNSLNSIQNYIVNNDVMNAAIYLSKFSKLIRRILDNSNHTLLPFEQIIETLKMYVEMEAFRFNNEFTYQFIVDEDLLNLKLPPMLLQPFVENAIWHGLMPKKGPKQLTIKIERGSTGLVCIIDDNGMGRNRQQKKEGHTSRGENMTKGMIESLKQLQGIDANLQVIDKRDDSGAPAGTMVLITIPIN